MSIVDVDVETPKRVALTCTMFEFNRLNLLIKVPVLHIVLKSEKVPFGEFAQLID